MFLCCSKMSQMPCPATPPKSNSSLLRSVIHLSFIFSIFVLFSFLWICTEYLCLYLRRERIPSADWEVSSLLMSCFLMLDDVPVKDLKPPAILTFNTSVSSNPLSLYPACLLYV